MPKNLIAAALVMVFALPVEARVQLKQSYPAIEQHIMFREPHVEIQFSEPVIEGQIIVTDYADRVISGAVEIEQDDTLSVPLTSPNPPRPFQGGKYKVDWRVKSKATGEPSGDVYYFYVHDHP